MITDGPTSERWRRYRNRRRLITEVPREPPGVWRWHDHRLHDCGCETAFDMDEWRSHAFERCAFHAALENSP